MRREFARTFYSSGAWKKCRALYAKSVGGVCERCIKKGMIKPIDEVHHKIALTPENINDPEITLNWGNLEGLCEKCHKTIRKNKKRYLVGEDGRITIPTSPRSAPGDQGASTPVCSSIFLSRAYITPPQISEKEAS